MYALKKFCRACGVILIIGIFIFTTIVTVFAQEGGFGGDILINTDSYEIIDEGDELTDVVIQFGDKLEEKLAYTRGQSRFEFTDDLFISGVLRAEGNISGTSLTVTGLRNCQKLITDDQGNIVCTTSSGTILPNQPEHPIEDLGLSVYRQSEGHWTLGYLFSPMVSGQITQLNLRATNEGARAVKLYGCTNANCTQGTLLAESQITGSGQTGWVKADITPIDVLAGERLVVTSYHNFNAYYFSGFPERPVTSAHVMIEEIRYGPGDIFPANEYSYTYIFGQPDITFIPTGTTGTGSTAGGDLQTEIVTSNLQADFVETGNLQVKEDDLTDPALELALDGANKIPSIFFGQEPSRQKLYQETADLLQVTGAFQVENNLSAGSLSIATGSLVVATDGSVVANSGNDSIDFQIKSLNQDYMFYVDGDTDRVGIGTNTPGQTLDVEGTIAANDLQVQNLTNCDTIDTDANGNLVCGTDEAGSGGGGLSSYFDVYDSSGGQNVANATTVNLNAIRYSHSDYSLSSDVITINTDGDYAITITGSYRSGGSRLTVKSWLELNTGSGFAEEQGAYCYSYHRNATDGHATCNRRVILSLAVGDQIRLRADETSTSTVNTIANGSSITIEKLN